MLRETCLQVLGGLSLCGFQKSGCCWKCVLKVVEAEKYIMLILEIDGRIFDLAYFGNFKLP
jgi:hypothetical protein